MSRRTAKFVSVLFASLFTGIPLVTVSHGATEAADGCLSGPKGTAPQGRHWYYRVDRATRRNCWYLGVAGEKVTRAAAGNPALPARPGPPPAAPSNNADTEKSIANARAEWPFPQTRIEQAPSSLAPQRTPAAPEAAEINQRDNAGDAGDQRSVVATRWLDPANMAASAAPQTSATSSAARPLQSSESPPPSPAAAMTLAAADVAPAKPTGSVPMLLIVMLGALSVAGLIGSAIVRFGRLNWSGRDVIVDRRVNWESARTHRPSLSEEAMAAGSMRELGIPRASHAADDSHQRISQMLERLSRGAAA
jgi:hypothetical protein